LNTEIKKIKAIEILDSRGNPTVEVHLTTDTWEVKAAVPSGASTGAHEAVELRDNDERYNGKGVLNAIDNVNKIISKKLVGMDCSEQDEIDKILLELDGTNNKSKLGTNAILGVSIAVCRAGAIAAQMQLYGYLKFLSKSENICLPLPQLNVINSGKHAGIENDIQEHMILPMDFKTFSEALRAGVETYHALKGILEKKYGASATLLGDEGGFAPPLKDIEKRLDLIMKAIKEAGYENKIELGLDCAASEFYKNEEYQIIKKKYSKEELVDFYKELTEKYPIVTIEDGMSEDDFEGWKLLNQQLGNKIQLVGDDLLVTNKERIQRSIKEKHCNALLLKINQIGTITESIDASKLAVKNNWNVVVSHRSGETEDSFIADLVVGLNASQSKFGAPARSERNAKYNQLLRIEDELQGKGFKGKSYFK